MPLRHPGEPGNALSRPVVSRQVEPHPRLLETVIKHRDFEWRRPISDHGLRSFEKAMGWIREWDGPLILDTGCGTGMSTMCLAKRFPEHLILGVDKSEDRLRRRTPESPPNARWIRADLSEFWILAARECLEFERQCFYYPNPWPKPEQRLRRWPFHPVLPIAVSCGGLWELRTNWKVYAQEFEIALTCLEGVSSGVELWSPLEPETLFERKYLASGHELWRCVVVMKEAGMNT